MTKRILLALWACLCLQIMIAQTMSDEQVMRYIVKEHEAGRSQAQIVTRLMQRGVDIAQIRRVKTKFERQAKQSGMGNLGDDASKDNGKRQRTNNGKTRSDYGKQANKQANGVTSNRIKSIPDKSYKHTYDEDDEEFMDFQNEMMEIIPDTATLLKQLMDERDKEQKKVFGHDIFNNQELTFEPNMNIATPQDYRIGPGDEVIIDVYGASQKTEQCTVSPDGEVIVEGFGPIQVSGLTVAQANARVRSTLGSRYSSSQVKLTIGQTRTIMVNVMGEVLAPGTYTLSAFSTVFHALYMAGGINEIGTLRNIKVYRNNALLTSVDIYDYILNGKMICDRRVEFAGHVFDCVDEGFGDDAEVDVVIRPEDIYIMNKLEGAQFGAKVKSCIFKGVHYEMFVDTDTGYELMIQDYNAFEPGSEVGLIIRPNDIQVMRKERSFNSFEAEMVDETHVTFLGEEFECAAQPGIKSGDKVTAVVEFSKVELTDHQEDGKLAGEVHFLLYKGDHYHLTILTEDGDHIWVDTNDIWDKGDLVGINFAPKDIKLLRRNE